MESGPSEDAFPIESGIFLPEGTNAESPYLKIPRGGGFKIFVISTPVWGRFPIRLMVFKWVETTN